ncbi:MAG TPA: hypothetical protein VL242_00715 [Sorangium sp.]|nr:hypothetical protein [Sorangium sp.]
MVGGDALPRLKAPLACGEVLRVEQVDLRGGAVALHGEMKVGSR